ncbi:MAG: ribulose-phosphate 3-epimerase [Patescibacteria group bacterium]
MIEVIPTIIAKDFEELKEKVKKVEPYVEWVQLDVMDGKFVDNITWNKPEELKELETSLNLEAHLMVEKPEEIIQAWIDSGVKRIIFHYESTQKHKEILEQVKSKGLEVGLAINPNTPIEVLDQYIFDLDLVLIMTVEPGKNGQELIKDTLVKIKRLREAYQNVKVSVDGGISLETAPEVISLGANILSIGSAIFKSDNIEETINKLKQVWKLKR